MEEKNHNTIILDKNILPTIAIIISILSPIAVSIGFAISIGTYKNSLDRFKNYFNPAWVQEYGELHKRVDVLEDRVKMLVNILDREIIDKRLPRATTKKPPHDR